MMSEMRDVKSELLQVRELVEVLVRRERCSETKAEIAARRQDGKGKRWRGRGRVRGKSAEGSDEPVQGRKGDRRQMVCRSRLWYRKNPDRRDCFHPYQYDARRGYRLLTTVLEPWRSIEQEGLEDRTCGKRRGTRRDRTEWHSQWGGQRQSWQLSPRRRRYATTRLARRARQVRLRQATGHKQPPLCKRKSGHDQISSWDGQPCAGKRKRLHSCRRVSWRSSTVSRANSADKESRVSGRGREMSSRRGSGGRCWDWAAKYGPRGGTEAGGQGDKEDGWRGRTLPWSAGMGLDPLAANPKPVLQVVGRGMNTKLLLRRFFGAREKAHPTCSNSFTMNTGALHGTLFTCAAPNMQRSFDRKLMGADMSLQFVWNLREWTCRVQTRQNMVALNISTEEQMFPWSETSKDIRCCSSSWPRSGHEAMDSTLLWWKREAHWPWTVTHVSAAPLSMDSANTLCQVSLSANILHDLFLSLASAQDGL